MAAAANVLGHFPRRDALERFNPVFGMAVRASGCITHAVSHTRLQGGQVLLRKLKVFQDDPWLLSATLPHEPSIRGDVMEPVRQLRDPALFEADGRSYLLYSVAGESGIAIAELFWHR